MSYVSEKYQNGPHLYIYLLYATTHFSHKHKHINTHWSDALSKTITSDNISNVNIGRKNYIFWRFLFSLEKKNHCRFCFTPPNQFYARNSTISLAHTHFTPISFAVSPPFSSTVCCCMILSENAFSQSILILCIIFQCVNCTASDGMNFFPIRNFVSVPLYYRISYHWQETVMYMWWYMSIYDGEIVFMFTITIHLINIAFYVLWLRRYTYWPMTHDSWVSSIQVVSLVLFNDTHIGLRKNRQKTIRHYFICPAQMSVGKINRVLIRSVMEMLNNESNWLICYTWFSFLIGYL